MTETLADRIFLNEPSKRESLALAQWLADDAAGASRRPEITQDFARLVARVLRDLGEGKTVTVGSLPEDLTTTVAADQLGVSRATLMKWIREGALPSHKVGSHTRVKTADVLALRKKRLSQQRKALEELIQMEDELGL